MSYQKKLKRFAALSIGVTLFFACQKLNSPPLGDYPKDSNPPGGPLKFYAAMDETDVDSLRANYGTDNDASFVEGGVTGKAAQFDGSKNGYIVYGKANEFGASTSFTISFWMNITLAQKDNEHAVGIMALSSTSNFWGNATFYADNNAKSPTDSMDLKMHFGGTGGGDNWDFAGYNFEHAWPKMYDGQWHLVTFTFDAGTKVGTVYRDGEQFDQKTNEVIEFTNVGQFVVGGYQEAAGVVDSYSNNTWMAGFPGMIDNIRLYGVALSAADVKALYDNKQ